jgi:hypothetical protein
MIPGTRVREILVPHRVSIRNWGHRMSVTATVMSKAADLRMFYELLERLAVNIAGREFSAVQEGSSIVLPSRGVYFFLENGESRSGSGAGSRVVRVGTHVLKTGAAHGPRDRRTGPGHQCSQLGSRVLRVARVRRARRE